VSAPTAEVLTIGTELLAYGRRDTNGAELSATLEALGFRLRRRATIADDLDEIRAALQEAAARSSLVAATGGLGPTADDVTRDALALAFGRDLREDPALLATIEERFRAIGRPMAASNRRQALVPEGAVPLPNPEGSAPGLWLDHAGGAVVLLPGPPPEMRAVLSPEVRERLRRRFRPPAVARRALLTSGIAESDLEDRLGDLYRARPEATVTVLARPGLVEILILARHGDAATAEAAADEVARLARERVGAPVFAEGDMTLAAHLGDRLRRLRRTVAVAESCTGGLLGADLTEAPGASDFFLGGLVAYADRVKQEGLGVPRALLRQHGAVSEPVARAMAEGVRRRLGADYGVAITGIAGPGGGTPEKPVGTVCLAVADAAGAISRRRLYRGGRERVRQWSVAAALHLLRTRIEEAGGR
jgi:nicotinamide-nucleotide amidase